MSTLEHNLIYIEAPRDICIIIHQLDSPEKALDFILGASNLTENICVIFVQEGVKQIDKFKALKGFEIHAVYAEKESLAENKVSLSESSLIPISHIISRDAVKNHVAHCQQVFAF